MKQGKHEPFIRYCKNSGLPTPTPEHKFHHTRKWRFDYAWIDKKVALEVEGGIWTGGRHTRGAGFQGDMEKYNEAVVLGWTVIRTTPSALYGEKLLDTLRRVL